METSEPKVPNLHPLDVMGEDAIKKAYTVFKVIHIIIAASVAIGGIVMLSFSKTTNPSSYRETINIGMLVGGICTMVFGPLAIWIQWIFVRLIFMLFYDVSLIRKKTLSDSKKR